MQTPNLEPASALHCPPWLCTDTEPGPVSPTMGTGTHPIRWAGGQRGCCSSLGNSVQAEQWGPGGILSCREGGGFRHRAGQGMLRVCHAGEPVPMHCAAHHGSEWPLAHFTCSLPPAHHPSPGTSPLQSTPQVLRHLWHPKSMERTSHWVPIPCTPHSHSSQQGQGRARGHRTKAAMVNHHW